jgi:hypothetical protein
VKTSGMAAARTTEEEVDDIVLGDQPKFRRSVICQGSVQLTINL